MPARYADIPAPIPGTTLAVNNVLGHVPMSEHPEAFRAPVADALDRLPYDERVVA